ncbi:hypothetical protein [Dehalobacter sp. TeCB1]|uniref:hypothetical protein n=1 Tax=Dehalobacter sp. TeCB1 TaxID=1843715 RepID=UPI00083B62C6|nr:hypothetical protein [Dehalobacter sp. TeCB1]OCZ54309.1 hypothetical protein A7D23_05945 [Dehalobacter sp. TeCB1]
MAKTFDIPYPQVPQIGKVTLTTADASLTAPTTAGQVLMTGGAEGTRMDGIKVRALGTNVQTVLRVFFNDGLGTAAANFSLVYEVKLSASTASATDVSQASDVILLPINYDGAGSGVLPPVLKAGQKIYVSLGTTVAAGYAITGMGGDY